MRKIVNNDKIFAIFSEFFPKVKRYSIVGDVELRHRPGMTIQHHSLKCLYHYIFYHVSHKRMSLQMLYDDSMDDLVHGVARNKYSVSQGWNRDPKIFISKLRLFPWAIECLLYL